MDPAPPVTEVLALLARAGTLTADQAESLFEELLNGRLADAQIGAVLAVIQSRGATVDELVGAARAMRRHVTAVPFSPPPDPPPALIDTCGTGGAPKTFNISTAAAIVAAAASPHHLPGRPRVYVAKHGNRSRSGRGSAEVLAALGVNVDAAPTVQARCLREAGVCFCFAIHHHPAVRHAAGPRKALGFPTIFNLLGPLTNPAGADRQLIGVYDPTLVEPVARALSRLGARRALVVHSHDGLDELSTTAPTRLAAVEPGQVHLSDFDARSLGLAPAQLADLAAADVQGSAQSIREILNGRAGPRLDVVALNAAAALLVADAVPSLAEGLHAAVAAIDSGQAAATLDHLVRISNEPA